MILHSHGWGGSRTTDPAAFQQWLDAGYGVLSFDQRGFGESGGHGVRREPATSRATTSARLVDADRPNCAGCRRTDRATRGSARSAAATAAATSSSAPSRSCGVHGKPVFDALAPEITWNDLNTQPGPEGVVRTEWALALAPPSLPDQALPPAGLQGARRGRGDRLLARRLASPAPRTCRQFFERNGPALARLARVAASTSPCSSARAPPTPCSTSSRGWTTGAPRSRERPASTASSSATTAATCCPRSTRTGVDVASDPCSEKLAGGDFADARAAVHEREAQGQGHRPEGLRQAPPRHARLDVYDGRQRRRRHRGRRRHGRHHRDRRRRPRLPGRAKARSASPGRRTSPGP